MQPQLAAERVHQVRGPTPDDHVHDAVREEVVQRLVLAGVETGERVRVRGRRGPRHREDHVQRHVQGLSAVDVTEARRVGQDQVGAKRRRVRAIRVGPRAGGPRRGQDLGDHRAAPRDVLDDLIEAPGNNATAGLHHVVHQIAWITGQRIELEPGLLDERTEVAMGRDAHAMPLRQPAADGDERLHVAPRADDHDDDRQSRHLADDGAGGRRGGALVLAHRGGAPALMLQSSRQELGGGRVQEPVIVARGRHLSTPAARWRARCRRASARSA